MNRFVFVGAIVTVVSGILMFACSSTPAYCSNAVNAGSTFTTKFGSCDAGGVFTFPKCSSSAESNCATAFNQCATADQNTLNNQVNCINNQPTCVPGMELQWFESLGACEQDAGTISSTCAGYFQAQFPDGGC